MNFQGGGKPRPTIHGPGGLIRALVGATLAVALGGGGVWLKFVSMGAPSPCLGGLHQGAKPPDGARVSPKISLTQATNSY
jgi:hypothetical protein